MCFSAQADLVAGTMVTAVGVDAVRQVRRPAERALALLPALLGAHLLVESVVWLSMTGDVARPTGRAAAVAYVAFALCVLPILVPVAVRAVEPDPGRRRALAWFAAAGAVLASVYLSALRHGHVDVAVVGHHLAYGIGLRRGGLLAAGYVVVACGAPLLSSVGRIRAFGVANVVAVAALAWLQRSALTSLWCAWAAVASVAIATYLRREHPTPSARVTTA